MGRMDGNFWQDHLAISLLSLGQQDVSGQAGVVPSHQFAAPFPSYSQELGRRKVGQSSFYRPLVWDSLPWGLSFLAAVAQDQRGFNQLPLSYTYTIQGIKLLVAYCCCLLFLSFFSGPFPLSSLQPQVSEHTSGFFWSWGPMGWQRGGTSCHLMEDGLFSEDY